MVTMSRPGVGLSFMTRALAADLFHASRSVSVIG